MQLNPARGRKREYATVYPLLNEQVYAAQPREGTETTILRSRANSFILLVYAAQPREGTETP